MILANNITIGIAAILIAILQAIIWYFIIFKIAPKLFRAIKNWINYWSKAE